MFVLNLNSSFRLHTNVLFFSGEETSAPVYRRVHTLLSNRHSLVCACSSSSDISTYFRSFSICGEDVDF